MNPDIEAKLNAVYGMVDERTFQIIKCLARIEAEVTVMKAHIMVQAMKDANDSLDEIEKLLSKTKEKHHAND